MISRLTAAAASFAVLATLSIAWATGPGHGGSTAAPRSATAGPALKTLPTVVIDVVRRTPAR